MWQPIETAQALPAIGTSESQTMDFKAAPTSDSFEMAKDIAALANAHGGSLIYGAAGRSQLATWLPLTDDQAKKCEREVDQAVRDRCRPGPLFGIQRVSVTGGCVVVVNVFPFLGQLVGVRLLRDEVTCGSGGKKIDDVFWFPIRVGTHTKAITPEQIPMYIDARVRRVAVSLESLLGQRVLLISTKFRGGEESSWVNPAVVKTVDALTNQVEFGLDADRGVVTVPIPIDMIATLCKATPAWHVYVNGVITDGIHWASDAPVELRSLETFFNPLG